MKKIFLFLFLYINNSLFAQIISEESERILTDSILNKYLYHGAWKYSIFSREWNSNIDSALSILPNEAIFWEQKGMPYFKERKYEVGMMYLDSSVKYDYGDHHCLEYRAFMKCVFQKNYYSAIEDFKLCTKYKGNSYIMDHPYSFYLGLCYLQLNKFDSAFNYINKLVLEEKLKKNDSSVHFLHWFYLGIIYFEKENYEMAINCFNKSLMQYVNFSDAKFYKGLSFLRQNEYKIALELIEESKKDYNIGYTITEDNAIYELYPYQINNFILNMYHTRLKNYFDIKQVKTEK